MNIKKIVKFDEKISNFIHNLRNKDYVRKSSIKSSKIRLKTHKAWIKKFFKKNNKLYIIKKNEVPIGYVRLELERKVYKTSWALTKNFQNRGYAKKGLIHATKSKKYKYKALIKNNNEASIKIALHSKFKIKRSRKGIIYLYKS
tara:strand:- start:49 stop:480 length:432 start_codon:yes stop_codon:yes gene_type:complete